jgi:hypothetical protein
MIFFVVFFSLYGAMHAYAFYKARTAFGFGGLIGAALGIFVLAAFTPSDPRPGGYDLPARTLSRGYTGWRRCSCSFAAPSSSILSILPCNKTIHRTSRRSWRVRWCRSSYAFIAVGISVYGYFDALDIRTERLTIETAKLPKGVDRVRIVQISDVHLGLIVRCSRMERVLEIVKAERPDIFVSTGDLVDAQINHLPGLRELLRQIKPRYGSYAITGNHEYYAGLQTALRFTADAGFTLLRGAAVPAGPIIVAGADDETGAQMKKERPARPETSIGVRKSSCCSWPALDRAGYRGAFRSPAFRTYASRPDLPLPVRERPVLSVQRRVVRRREGVDAVRQPRHGHLGAACPVPVAAGSDGDRSRQEKNILKGR